MRKIKFRAWDIPCKTMRPWEWIRKCEYPFDHDEGGVDLLTPEHFFLMQYTGLKDKNGKEIYEGDLLHDSYGQLRRVEWLERTASFVCRSIPPFALSDCPLSMPIPFEPEVIGNIYENPELLK